MNSLDIVMWTKELKETRIIDNSFEQFLCKGKERREWKLEEEEKLFVGSIELLVVNIQWNIYMT